jgi:hypothetical protein
MWLLPLASGFACGCFAGPLRLSGPISSLAIAATGGFAVWLLSYYLLPKPVTPALNVGDDSVVYGRVPPGNIGSRSVIIGATDTNTILNELMALGHSVQGGPSIAIGANAQAGNLTIINLRDTNTSADFNFDYAQSFPCGLQTEDSRHTNKLVFVLYKFTIVGKGTVPIYVNNLLIEGKFGGKWLAGSRIFPKVVDTTNRFGTTKTACLHGPDYKVFMQNWRDTILGEQPLQYGQPPIMSYAALFDIEKRRFQECEQLQITLTDTLGQKYQKQVEVTQYMKDFVEVANLVY